MFRRLSRYNIFGRIFVGLSLTMTILWYIHDTSERAEVPIRTAEKPIYTCCVPLNRTRIHKQIFFLKTHKTGSSTIHNILFRFAERYSLTVMHPIYYTYYLPFSPFYSIWPQTVTPNNKYHILASHMRYTSQIRQFQYPNTPLVTILRHPATLFQSIYEYFDFIIASGLSFKQFLRTPNKPESFICGDSIVVYRGYNQMSYDLGFDLANKDNQTAIDEFVHKIDTEFDFVMITEQFDASLVLLANLMGWPFEYLVYLKHHVRPTHPNDYVLTERDTEILLKLNHVDAALYKHFYDKFQICVRQYGADKLNRQVMKLREMNKQFEGYCTQGKNKLGLWGTVGYEIKNASWECEAASKNTFFYMEELKLKQSIKLFQKKLK